jgi:hypothetical protein
LRSCDGASLSCFPVNVILIEFLPAPRLVPDAAMVR